MVIKYLHQNVENQKYYYTPHLTIFATLGLMTNNSAIFYVDDVAKSEIVVHPAQVIIVFFASLFLYKNKFNLDTAIGVFFSCLGMYFVLK